MVSPSQLTLGCSSGWAMLSWLLSPADAQLYVNDKLVGSASQELELIALPQRLEVRKEGYESWFSTVTPKPGLPQRFNVQLLTPQQAVIAGNPDNCDHVGRPGSAFG